jgi:hypothetical protein
MPSAEKNEIGSAGATVKPKILLCLALVALEFSAQARSARVE